MVTLELMWRNFTRGLKCCVNLAIYKYYLQFHKFCQHLCSVLWWRNPYVNTWIWLWNSLWWMYLSARQKIIYIHVWKIIPRITLELAWNWAKNISTIKLGIYFSTMLIVMFIKLRPESCILRMFTVGIIQV